MTEITLGHEPLVRVEAQLDLAHYHYVDRARRGLIELRELTADEQPGPLHGSVCRQVGGDRWYWRCAQCQADSDESVTFASDTSAWLAFLKHEDDEHSPLAVIVSIDDWRLSHVR